MMASNVRDREPARATCSGCAPAPLDRRRAHTHKTGHIRVGDGRGPLSTSRLWFQFGLRVPSGALTARTFLAVDRSPRQCFVKGVRLT